MYEGNKKNICSVCSLYKKITLWQSHSDINSVGFAIYTTVCDIPAVRYALTGKNRIYIISHCGEITIYRNRQCRLYRICIANISRK